MYLCKTLKERGFPSNYSKTSKSDVFNFLSNIIIDNSGYLSKEVNFKRYFSELYEEFLKFPIPDFTTKFSQRLYHFLLNDKDFNLGKCKYCGKRTTFKNLKEGYHQYCSITCVNKSCEHKDKITQTQIKKCGSVKNFYQKRNEKTLKTIKEKYGDDITNVMKVDKIKQKMCTTFIKNNGGTKEIAYAKRTAKTIQTCLKRYNCTNGGASSIAIKKIKKAASQKTKEEKRLICNKMFDTKKKRGTSHSSKIEILFAKWLTQNNFEYIYQYNTDIRYPFNCDFYLPKYDLFIELQGMWTHGFHPFNDTDENDIKILKKWKSHKSKFYNSAINIWTIKDPLKRKTAYENKLSYLEIFSNNIDCIIMEFLNKLKELERKG